jgi:hypothetical protein
MAFAFEINSESLNALQKLRILKYDGYITPQKKLALP